MHVTDFQRALELLIADRSPRSCTRTLSDQELRMLVFAQALRGTRYRPCRPAFLCHLRDRIAWGQPGGFGEEPRHSYAESEKRLPT